MDAQWINLVTASTIGDRSLVKELRGGAARLLLPYI